MINLWDRKHKLSQKVVYVWKCWFKYCPYYAIRVCIIYFVISLSEAVNVLPKITWQKKKGVYVWHLIRVTVGVLMFALPCASHYQKLKLHMFTYCENFKTCSPRMRYMISSCNAASFDCSESSWSTPSHFENFMLVIWLWLSLT